MKKTISIITFLILMIAFIFNGNVYAAYIDLGEVELDPEVDMDVEIDKTKVAPGENVKLTVTFGERLRKYTVKVSYDNNIFEYVSAEGGTATDTTDKINVVFEDNTGNNSRDTMSVTFKAKENITTSNPTELTVTAEGLVKYDLSDIYEDILVPVVKNITVEPQYEDYKIKLDRPEAIIKGKETEMKITYSSSMGHYYEHARLVAEVTTPEGANAKLLGVDGANLEHDILQSGWGDPQGYKIGGKDVEQILNVKGTFSEVGSYTITLSLIDRDNSDREISSSTFLINVTEETTTPLEPSTQVPDEAVGAINNTPIENTALNTTNTATPAKLPKTGINMYIPVGVVIIVLMAIYVYHNKKENY